MPADVIGANMKSGAMSPTFGAGIAAVGAATPTGVAAVTTGSCADEAHAAMTVAYRSGLKRFIKLVLRVLPRRYNPRPKSGQV
jgi:hypothetical protein